MRREIAAWVLKDGQGYLCHDGDDWCGAIYEHCRVYFRSEEAAEMAYRRYRQACGNDHADPITWKAVPVYMPKDEAAADALRARIILMRHTARIEPSPERTLVALCEAIGCSQARPKSERVFKFPSQDWW